MKWSLSRFSIVLVVCGVVLAMVRSTWACAVCYGDPNAPMVRGAQQGILAMLIITYAVLIGIGGMFAFVIFRARRR